MAAVAQVRGIGVWEERSGISSTETGRFLAQQIDLSLVNSQAWAAGFGVIIEKLRSLNA